MMKTADLIGGLYESIGDADALDGMLRHLITISGSCAARLGIFDRKGKWLKASAIGVPPGDMDSYARYLSTDLHLFERKAVVRLTDESPERSMVATSFAIDADHACGLALMRLQKDGEYRKADLGRIAGLLPHVRKVVILHLRFGVLESRIASLDGLLEQLSAPVLFVDRTGILRHANSAGREALRAGTHLIVRNGRVEPRSPRQRQQLSDLLSLTLETPDAGKVMRLFAPNDTFAVLTAYCGGRLPGASVLPPDVALVLTVVGALQTSVRRAQKVFGLTPAEGRLAEHLARGCVLSEIAEELHISRETLKSQLDSLFAKTNTHRQAELIAVLLASTSLTIT